MSSFHTNFHAPDKIEKVKETIARLQMGWNHKNAYLWSSAFTEPCEYIDGFGRYHRQWTRLENQVQHEKVWATVYAKSFSRFLLESIEFLAENHAAAIIRCVIDYEVNQESKTSEHYLTLVLVKEGGEWHIRNYHNTTVRSLH